MKPGRRLSQYAAACGALCLLSSAVFAQTLAPALDKRGQANVEDLKSQNRIDTLSDQTDQMASEYRTTIDQVESLRVYNRQMEGLVGAQQEEMDSLRAQIDDIELVGRGVTPLMLEMLDALEAFVALDLPFLPGERSTRVSKLREMMDRPDVTDSEKYRRILEAYEIENEYGRTVEAYRGPLADGRIVDFLRIGRIALLYQSADGEESAAWDASQTAFVALDSSDRSSIKEGLRIARKQARPDLIRVPLPAASPAEGPR